MAVLGAACSSEDGLTVNGQSDPDAVTIKASVGNPLAMRTNPTADNEGQRTAFNPGDVISVSAGTQDAVTYTFDGTNWTPTAGQYLKWESSPMNFTAYYPVTDGTSVTSFTLPADQSSEEKIAAADYMTLVNRPLDRPTDGHTAGLTLNRQTARVIVRIEGFRNEFSAATPTIGDMKITSGAAGDAGGTASGDPTPVTPYVQTPEGATAGQTGTTYTALVIPGETQTGQAFLTLTVEGKSLTVTGIPAMEAGKSYTYPLTEGKDALTVGEVTVEDWTSGELTEDQGYAVSPLVDPATHTIYVNAGDIADYPDSVYKAMAGTGELHVAGSLTQADLDCLTTTFHDSFTLFDLSQATAAEELTLNRENSSFPRIETLVPGPVSHIADYAFMRTENLKEVDFSHSPWLISIGKYGFYITSLDSLDLSHCPKIQDLGTGAFAGISTLKSVNLSGCASLSQLGDALFSACPALESVDLSGCSNLTTIGNSVFYGCTSLKKFDFTVLPNLTDIESGAFSQCSALENIDFSQCPKLSTIGRGAFSDCSALKSVDFSGCTRLTSIGLFSFDEDKSITDVYFGGENPPANFSGTFSDGFEDVASQCTLHLSTTAQDNSAWTTFVGNGWNSTVYDWN